MQRSNDIDALVIHWSPPLQWRKPHSSMLSAFVFLPCRRIGGADRTPGGFGSGGMIFDPRHQPGVGGIRGGGVGFVPGGLPR